MIYSATELATRRRVALKHIVRRSAEDDRFLEQAENEYSVARLVNHPYLRKCYDIIRIRRWLKTVELFLILELVEGERLEDRFPETPTDAIDDATEIFAQIAEGLQALHRVGYVHADMKPHNVLLTPGGVKIIDFGQSCPVGDAKPRVQGTPDFIAPEQIEREPLDQRTDVFNLGATMYRIVTGKAFATDLPMGRMGSKKMEMDMRRGNAPPQEMNPAVPLPLSRLIMDCVERDRKSRPFDMGQVLSRLDTVRHVLSRRAPGVEAAPDKT